MIFVFCVLIAFVCSDVFEFSEEFLLLITGDDSTIWSSVNEYNWVTSRRAHSFR